MSRLVHCLVECTLTFTQGFPTDRSFPQDGSSTLWSGYGRTLGSIPVETMDASLQLVRTILGYAFVPNELIASLGESACGFARCTVEEGRMFRCIVMRTWGKSGGVGGSHHTRGRWHGFQVHGAGFLWEVIIRWHVLYEW